MILVSLLVITLLLLKAESCKYISNVNASEKFCGGKTMVKGLILFRKADDDIFIAGNRI